MLGLFAAKSGHPLADTREAKRVLGELPAQDPAAALDAAGAWLESLPATADFRPERRLELILQIDETLVPQTRRLCREYLTAKRQGRTQEFRQWQINRRYWGHLVVAYEDVMVRYLGGEKGAEAIKSHLPLLCSRLLHAYGSRLKWDQFRYGPIDPQVWAAAGGTYQAALQARADKKVIRLYGAESETSVEAEYLRLLVFQASSMDNLLPVEIEIAERVIAHVLPAFVLIEQVHPDNVYWVDIHKPLRPTRLAKLPEITSGLRFFNTRSALAALAKLRATVEATGNLPAEVNFGGQYSAQVALPVLNHLMANWALVPPMRDHPRRRVKSRMTVVDGIANVYQRLAGLPIPEDEVGESWVVEDVSQGGIGAHVALIGQDWLRVGCLLGMQPEGGNNWLIGVVRRFSRESDAIGVVGVQTLSKTPQSFVADSGGLRTEILLLDPLALGADVAVVLPDMAWEEKTPMRLLVGSGGYRLLPLALEETAPGYTIGRYRVEAPT
jgi:hypothetical protein